MKSWRTTSIGTLAVLFYLGYKLYKNLPISADELALALGVLGVSAAAKDSSVHSTEADVSKATVKALDKAINTNDDQSESR